MSDMKGGKMDEVLYKWLLADRRSPIQKEPWPVDDLLWTPSVKPVICKSGWHGMVEKDVLAHLPGVGALLYEVEIRGDVVSSDNKFAAESMRIVNFIGEATEQRLRLFMCDVAEDVLPIYEAYAPNDDRPRKSIEAGRAYALDPTSETKAAWAAGAAEAAGAAARKEAMEKYSNWLVVRIESDL